MQTNDGYIDTHFTEPLVGENAFLEMPPEDATPPSFEDAWNLLPQPFWEGHEDAIACYRGAWELAFGNLRRPEPGSGFVASFIDTAFNDCLFMWDSAFILLFARYGRRAFDFHRTLDNLYASQHPDGFICREISTLDGRDRFERFDATSTGPNVMAVDRVGALPRLRRPRHGSRAFFRFSSRTTSGCRRHRTWRDGTYWTSGLGLRDGQPAPLPARPACRTGWPERLTYHGHAVWIDMCLQQILSADLLLRWPKPWAVRKRSPTCAKNGDRLSVTVNERLWSEETAFYHDELATERYPSQDHRGLLGAAGRRGAAGEDGAVRRAPRDPRELRASSPGTFALGRPSRVRPGRRLLARRGVATDQLHGPARPRPGRARRPGARDLARRPRPRREGLREDGNPLGELRPGAAGPGNRAKGDFVGWSGLAPIAGLLEYVLGLRADAPSRPPPLGRKASGAPRDQQLPFRQKTASSTSRAPPAPRLRKSPRSI